MADATERLNLLLTLGRYADGERAAREAIGREPEYAAGYTFLALFLLNQGRAEPALVAARDGVRRAPHDAWAHASLAVVLDRLAHLPAAAESIREALRLDPVYAYARRIQCQVLCSQLKFREAERAAREGLAHHPADERLLFWLGWARQKRGEWDPAAAVAEDGLRQYPESACLWNLLGCALWQSAASRWPLARVRAHRRAEGALREAVRRQPAEAAYHDNQRLNALAGRRYLIDLLLMGVAFLSVSSTLLGLAADPGGWIHPGFIGAMGMLAVLLLSDTKEPAFVLTAPLGRFGFPAFPLTRRERLTGRVRWFLTGAVLIGTPAVTWVAVLLRFLGSSLR